MSDTTIMIPVDEQTAKVYSSASAEEQKKIQLLLRLRLRELTILPIQSLQQIMDEIGNEAEARGLTSDILEEILRDE